VAASAGGARRGATKVKLEIVVLLKAVLLLAGIQVAMYLTIGVISAVQYSQAMADLG
jgi:hypothetical protein